MIYCWVCCDEIISIQEVQALQSHCHLYMISFTFCVQVTQQAVSQSPLFLVTDSRLEVHI